RADLAPALDAGEEPFDARPVAPHAVTVEFVFVNDQAAKCVLHPEPVSVSLETWMDGDPSTFGVLPIDRHQVFRSRKDKGIRIDGVEILWQAFVGLACNRRQRKTPA